MTTGAYLGAWLSHARGRVRPRTHDGYAGSIRLYAAPVIGEIPLADLTSLRLQGLYASVLASGRSGGTVVNLHLVLTQALSQAVRWGLIGANPAAGAQPPRPHRPEQVVIDEALAERILLSIAGTRLECPAAIALATGMRRGEILGLRWADISADLDLAQVRRTLHASTRGLDWVPPKTPRSRRAVALPAFLQPYLERQRAGQAARRTRLGERWVSSDAVVDSGDGRPLHPATLSSAWCRFCRAKGLPAVRFHDLRHGHATLLLLGGVHPKVVSERLGHASVGITLDLYSHVLPTMQAEAARAFDRLFAAG
ncbi:MAG: site-specific integrase [Actinomycetota bacterium]|nr:site-specific integrase [Actinomycetota bacterium]